MFKHTVRRSGILVLVGVITVLMIMGDPFRARADHPLGISNVWVNTFNCSSFQFSFYGNPGSGYAAVRIWKNSAGGTPLVDSYTAGYPSSYTAISGSTYPIGTLYITYPTQPSGTTLVARVYRALIAAPNSWDSQNFVDTQISCHNGITSVKVLSPTCSQFFVDGQSSPLNGYAAVRVWLNNTSGTPLVDSYVAGYPSYYFPINGDGQFTGTVNFGPVPTGTTLVARLYRAPSAVPGSWEKLSDYKDTTFVCAQ